MDEPSVKPKKLRLEKETLRQLQQPPPSAMMPLSDLMSCHPMCSGYCKP